MHKQSTQSGVGVAARVNWSGRHDSSTPHSRQARRVQQIAERSEQPEDYEVHKRKHQREMRARDLATAIVEKNAARSVEIAADIIAARDTIPDGVLCDLLLLGARTGLDKLLSTLHLFTKEIATPTERQNSPPAPLIGVEAYASLLSTLLIERPFNSTAVRLLLNLGLPIGSDPVSAVVPADSTAEQLKALEQTFEFDDPTSADDGFIVEPEDGEQQLDAAVAEGDQCGLLPHPDGSIPKHYWVQDCAARPDLNGAKFVRTMEFERLYLGQPDATRYPVYEQQAEEDGAGPAERSRRLYCFYWSFSSIQQGWWLGRAVGARKKRVGFCACTELELSKGLPPQSGWHIKPQNQRVGDRSRKARLRRQPDTMRLLSIAPQLEAVNNHDLAGNDAENSASEAAAKTTSRVGEANMRALAALELPQLMGRLRAVNSRAAAYFGHFCTLLHLEFLHEVSSIKRKLERYTGEQLQKYGRAVVEAQLTSVAAVSRRTDTGRSPQKAKSAESNSWRLRFEATCASTRLKKGESVLLSLDDPLLPVAEGSIQELGCHDRKIHIVMMVHESKQSSEEEWLATGRQWRIDIGPNRTSYNRQLDTLVKLCTETSDVCGSKCRPALYEMITSGCCTPQGHQCATVRKSAPAPPDRTRPTTTSLVELKSHNLELSPVVAAMNATHFPEVCACIHAIIRTIEDQQAECNKDDVSANCPAAEVSASIQAMIKCIEDQHAQSTARDDLHVGTSANVRAVHTAREDLSSFVNDLAAQTMQFPKFSLHQLRECQDSNGDDPLDAFIKQELDPSVLPSLNDSQRKAIEQALRRRCTVVQGPPGTGKTRVSIETLRLWAKMGLRPLLATSDTNIAVDNIAEGLAEAGVRVVRVGQSEKIRPELQRLSLDTQVKAKLAEKAMQQATHEKEQLEAAIEKEMAQLEREVGLHVSPKNTEPADQSAAIECVIRLAAAQDPPVKLDLLPTELELVLTSSVATESISGVYRLVLKQATEHVTAADLDSEGLNMTLAAADREMNAGCAYEYIQVTAAAANSSTSDSLENRKTKKGRGHREHLKNQSQRSPSAPPVRCVRVHGDSTVNGWWLTRSCSTDPTMEGAFGFCPCPVQAGSDERSCRRPTVLLPDLPPEQGWLVADGGWLRPNCGGFQRTHPLSAQALLKQLQTARRQVLTTAAEQKRKARESGAQGIDAARQEHRSKLNMQEQLLQQADVICVQMISAGSPFLSRLGMFVGILIDEVAQCTELATLVPIVQRGCQRLVLCGDHCQLPPAVISMEAEQRGAALSLYGRLVAQPVPVVPLLLDTQYRAHPKLMEFVAEKIYEGRLHSGIAADSRPFVPGFAWPRPDVPIAFVNVPWDETAGGGEIVEGESKQNMQEAHKLIATLERVLDADDAVTPGQVGVVSPYSAQVRLLRKQWNDLCKRRRGRSTRGTPGTDQQLKQWWSTPRLLEIASVDNFQGREKELILFSAVRCNRKGQLGFLSDWRRLNVMLTRARRGLVVFGSATTLRHDALWAEWLEWCDSMHVIVDRDESLRVLWTAIKGQVIRLDESKLRLQEMRLLECLPGDRATLKQVTLRVHASKTSSTSSLDDAVVDDMWNALAAARCGWRGWTAAIQQARGQSSADNPSGAELMKLVVADYCTRFEVDVESNAEILPDLRAQAAETLRKLEARSDATTVPPGQARKHSREEPGWRDRCSPSKPGTAAASTKQKVALSSSSSAAAAASPSPTESNLAAKKKKKKRKRRKQVILTETIADMTK